MRVINGKITNNKLNELIRIINQVYRNYVTCSAIYGMQNDDSFVYKSL